MCCSRESSGEVRRRQFGEGYTPSTVVEQEVHCGGLYVRDGEIDGAGATFARDGHSHVLRRIHLSIDIQRYFGAQAMALGQNVALSCCVSAVLYRCLL